MTDLPFGRGGSPLQNLIERGIKQTKISAIKCVKELDGGDIYLKRDLETFDKAEKSKILNKKLETEVPSSIYEELRSKVGVK